MKKLYMIVSKDEYELPLIVAESVNDIAVRIGKNVRDLYTCFSKGRNPKAKDHKYYRRYITVEVEDDD